MSVELILKTLMSGGILLGIVSCNPPTIEKPVVMYEVSLRFNESGYGLRNLNYKTNTSTVDEWIGDVKFSPLEDIPNELTCFSNRTWETVISPKLKEASEFYKDYND